MRSTSTCLRPGHRSQSTLALLVALSTLPACNLLAATYQWLGSTDSTWSTASNWSAVGIGETGGTFAHRLNVNNAGASELVYSSDLGTTVYAIPGNRGLVIGSGALGGGTFRITGGKFSTVGAGASDAIGNTGNTASLIIDGGEYETGRALDLGLTFGVTSNFTVNSGTATVAEISTNNTLGTINLNGGTLAMNRFIHNGGGTTFLNFNGGTLRARMSTTAFYPAPTNGVAIANLMSGGAIIDTNGFDITLNRPLVEDPLSPGGSLTKDGAGTLTLGTLSHITGAVTVNSGGLGLSAGPAGLEPASLTHSGTALNFNLGIYDPANPVAVTVPSLTLNTTDTTVNISGSSIPVASEIRILDYGTKSGPGSLKLNVASLPVNMVATLGENTEEGYYFLNVTSPSASSFTWSGEAATPGTGQWNTSSLSWNAGAAAYAEPALVSFPNILNGSIVNIVADAAPLSVAVDNAISNPYSFTGTGKITGATGITKTGTGIALFDGAAHSYSGTLAVNAGAVIKRKADDTTGPIIVAADNVSFVLDGGVTDGAGQILTISGRGATSTGYFFPGSAVQRGALQAHNGANTWQGDIVIASAAADTTRIGVQAGASLTLTGNISESVSGAGVILRAGNLGDNITLAGPGSYSYTGATQLFSTGASIILGANDKLPPAAAALMHSGGASVFDLNGFNQQISSLSGSAVGDAARISNNGASVSTLTISPPAGAVGFFQGRLVDGTGVLSVVKSGEGLQVLAADNFYTGTTTINGGTLEIGGGLATGSLLPASQIINNAVLSFHRNDTITQGTHFANGISGTGSLNKSGAGGLVLTSVNTYAGATVVNTGTLSLAAAGTVGAGQLALASGSLFDVSTSADSTVSLPGGLRGRGTINATDKTLSIGGAFAPVALAVTGNVSLASSASTALVAGTSPATTSQTIVTGSLTNNGTLSVSAEAGLTFADGQSYTFFAASDGITSGFTSVSVGATALNAVTPGIWTGTANDLTYTYTESTATLAVATATTQLSALQSWREQFFGSPDNTGNGADEADFDQDGLNNLLEYALGTDPTTATLGQVVVGRSGNFLTLTYPRRSPADPALTYTVQGSSNLADGFTAATGSTSEGSPSVYTDNVNVNEAGTRRFLRLQVTYTPAP